MYRLLIVDDEPLVQAGVKSMLNWAELGVEICQTAANGQAALDIIESDKPDIVITDIKMPVMNGLELARICLERYGQLNPAFILLTSYEDFHMAKAALSYQVCDYLIKLELTPELLKQSVMKVIGRLDLVKQKTKSSSAAVQPFYDKFFICLLHNLFESDEQFLAQSRYFHFNFQYAGYVCCYGEIVSPAADRLSAEKQLALFNSSLQMIKELAAKYRPVYAVSLDIRHFALIFCYAEPQPENYFTDISEILQRITAALHNYYNVSLRCGIGSPESTPQAVSESYHHARRAFLSSSEESPLQIFEQTPIRTSEHKSFNISLFRQDLIRAFEEYDPDILKQVIHPLCELFLSYPKYYLQAMDAACNILYLAISMLPNGESTVSGFFKTDPDGYRSIYKKSNMQQVIGWLTNFTEQLSALFVEKRKDHRNHLVSSVRKYIHEHLAERLTLNEVASVFGISPSYLSQLFGKYNDLGFTEYINTCKIKESKRLLKEEHLKIYEVADMLGFESPFYFSKVFKKIEGVSPTEYLNSGSETLV